VPGQAAGPFGPSAVRPYPGIKVMFASWNLTLDAQGQRESHVKGTSLCTRPNAKSLKSLTQQSQPKMLSDTGRAAPGKPTSPARDG